MTNKKNNLKSTINLTYSYFSSLFSPILSFNPRSSLFPFLHPPPLNITPSSTEIYNIVFICILFSHFFSIKFSCKLKKFFIMRKYQKNNVKTKKCFIFILNIHESNKISKEKSCSCFSFDLQHTTIYRELKTWDLIS